MSPAAIPVRDRLLPWIAAIEARRARLTDGPRATMDVVVELLTALHDRDAHRAGASLTDDVVIRMWGWHMGGRWEWTGDAARAALAAWLDATGEAVVTMRGDIDRFFPDDGVFGMDGDWSRLATDDAGNGVLVARRFGWFGTVRGRQIASMDLYWGIHEHIGISDRLAPAG